MLDGELLAWDEAGNLPRAFTALQTRIQRRKPGAATLRNTPVRVLAYDLLGREGEDLRGLPLQQRRAHLAEVIGALDDARIQISPTSQRTTGCRPPRCAMSHANAAWRG